MKKISLAILSILILSSCIEKKRRDLETPCVANEFGSESHDIIPCVRIPVNKTRTIS